MYKTSGVRIMSEFSKQNRNKQAKINIYTGN